MKFLVFFNDAELDFTLASVYNKANQLCRLSNAPHNANYVIINLEPEKRAFTQEDQSAQIQFIYLICGKCVVLHLLTTAKNIAMQKTYLRCACALEPVPCIA